MTRRTSLTALCSSTWETIASDGFAFVAIVLALVGIYGLMSFTVKQCTTEIRIRLAIGSPRSRLLTLILSQGMRLTTYGLLIGFAAALALTRLVSGWLFQVKATDPLTLALVLLATLGVACAACWLSFRIVVGSRATWTLAAFATPLRIVADERDLSICAVLSRLGKRSFSYSSQAMNWPPLAWR